MLPNQLAAESFRGYPTEARRLAERHIVGADHAQAREPEVRHSASGGADVERVARRYQDHA